jgi:maltose-binding protein MalE
MRRLIIVGVMTLGLVIGTTACGSSSSSKSTNTPTAPTLERGSNGHYFALVANKSEAKAVCKLQSALGAQLKKLGSTATVDIVEFHIGSGNPIIPSGNTYAYSAGDFFVISKNVALCGVAVS